MNLNAKTRQYADRIFQTYAEDVDIYLQSSQVKGEDYDPAYNVKKERTLQNARTVKAMMRDKTADSLIINNLGLTALGAKSIVVQEMNVSLLKLARKIIIKEEEYTPYHEAVGKKFQELDAEFGYSVVVLFKSGN